MSFNNSRQSGTGGSGDNGRRPADASAPTSSAAASASSSLLGGQTSMPTASGRLPSLRPTRDLTLGSSASGVVTSAAAPRTSVSANQAFVVPNFSVSSTASTPGANRRTFVPNLNAKSREKDKQPDRQKQAQKPKDSFNGAGRSSSSAKKPGKDQPDGKSNRPSHGNFVQTHSIFAEGLGGSERSTAGQARGRGFGGGGGGGRASSAAADEPV
uniref:BAT2_N domain-containing protein n=2 Tax=Macrostomum lignano TaxID=282301 RepID=A0A1I8GE56_9PLAT